MTREEKQKAIDVLKISAPVMVVTQEEFNDYIQTLNQVMDWLEQEPCEDEYIKVPKKALKYRTAGMVAYNAEWLKNHFDIERAVICGAQQSCDDLISRDEVIDILLNEVECVQRASDEECNRDCAKCDLLRDTNKILQAYRIAIRALEHPEENVVAIVPCDDAISRQKVLDVINLNWYYRKNCIEVIENLPSVNPQEPKTGHWEWLTEDKYRCSNCNSETRVDECMNEPLYDFCPFCGAKMIEPQERSDKE